MRFVKLVVNATSAGLCLLLDRTGHSNTPLNTVANLSLALSVLVLVVAAIHELVQGRAELLQGTRKQGTVIPPIDTSLVPVAEAVTEAVGQERFDTGQRSESSPALVGLRNR